MITFSWDPAKARANLRKHGVSFEEARSVFLDELAVQFFNDGNSEGEEVIRIISARRATRNESAHYGGPRS